MNEKAISKFANAKELNEFLVQIILRIRPFEEKEKLEEERKNPSY